ncbi:hypothetical protein ACH35V_18770 [Actinomadura sp. 1N219]|uniref:hypothetical protein n=1 Tax=Actinomadura sp. 1N219 TaxID=3375152 RepID=UPI00379A8770
MDLSDLEFWALPPDMRMAAYARLRELEAPPFFEDQPIPFHRAGRPLTFPRGGVVLRRPCHSPSRLAAAGAFAVGCPAGRSFSAVFGRTP